MSGNGELLRGLAFLRFLALKHRMEDRFDRYCHGGPVGLRLPLAYRLDCVNR